MNRFFRQLEADAIGTIPAIENSRRDKFRSLEPSAFPPLAGTRCVLRDRHREANQKHHQAAPQRGPQKIHKRLILVNPMAEKLVQLSAVDLHLLQFKAKVANLQLLRQ